jgi:hypothetical protein
VLLLSFRVERMSPGADRCGAMAERGQERHFRPLPSHIRLASELGSRHRGRSAKCHYRPKRIAAKCPTIRSPRRPSRAASEARSGQAPSPWSD